MADIPIEIFFHHILIRLPVKSLLRFKCVSKTWNCLLCDQEFVRMHLNHTIQRRSHKLILKSANKFYSVETTFESLKQCYSADHDFSINDKAEAVTVKPEFPLKDSQSVTEILGSCNGLLCVVVDERNNSSRPGSKIVVWNPSTGDSKLVSDPNPAFKRTFHFIGFAYDSSLDDYKILRIVDRSFEVYMYTLKTNSWKLIGAAPDNLLSVHTKTKGVAANGCIYWLGYSRCPTESYAVIACFDLKDESFRGFQLPDEMRPECAKGLKVLGGYLAVCQFYYGHEFQMWTMKDDKKEHWIKIIRTPICYLDTWAGEHMMRPVFIKKNGEIVAITWLEGSSQLKFVLYDPKTKCKQDVTTIHGFNKIVVFEETTYIESLVSPNFEQKG